ncbi:MAG: ATP-binding cassette domain-containing protein [Saprospiraceae bacterium]|nr:ATP-binding cassette domain-containing protein [Saprospiraceae bacterium]
MNPNLSPFGRFIQLAQADKRDILRLFIFAVFAGMVGLSIPLGVQAIINFIAIGQQTTSWVVLIIMVTVGTAIIGIAQLIQVIIIETLQQRIFVRSAFDFAYRIPRLKLEEIKDQYAPELANRFFDTLSVQKGLPKILVDIPVASFQIIFGLVVLALYNAFFLIFGLVIITLLIGISALAAPKGLRTSIIESKYKYKVAYWLEELGRTISSFKLAGGTQYPLEKTNSLLESYLTYRRKHFNILRWLIISAVSLKTIATGGFLLIGGLLVMRGELNIGQFVAAEIIIILILNAIEKILTSAETFFDVLTALEKIGQVSDIELESDKGIDFAPIARAKGIGIKIHNLSYKPEGSTDYALRDINLEIEAGERVFVTGYNASGKTTLLRILVGLYTNYQGSITYNDIPQKNINIHSLRSYMGDHITEEHLFEGSLKENITMGRQEVRLPDVINVCDRVGLTPYLQKLPEGLDTAIPSDGEGLAGSIIKKLILARCIVDMPQLVVTETLLDDNDFNDRQRFVRVLTDPKMPWTSVSISRDCTLASRCDRVIVLKDGKLIFNGTYEEVKQESYFNDLFNLSPFSKPC